MKNFKFTVSCRAGDGNGADVIMHWQNPPTGRTIPPKLAQAVNAIVIALGPIPLGGWGVDFWAWNVPEEWFEDDEALTVFESVDDLEVLDD